MPGKIRGTLALVFILSLFVFSSAPARAQTKTGEIININYKYKIAFADLTQNDLKPGDKVAVKDLAGTTVYLVTIEVYSVMVKLTVSTEPGFGLSDEEFAKIAVGSPVTVVDPSKITPPPMATTQPDPKKASTTERKGKAGQVNINWKGSAPLTGSGQTYVPVTQLPADKNLPRTKNTPVYDPDKITVRTETVAEPAIPEPSPVVTKPVTPPPSPAVIPPVDMDYKLEMLEQKVDKLVDSNLSMADQITKLLREKSALEEALKGKDGAIDLSRKQILNMAKQNSPQEQELKDLKDQSAKLKEEKAAADREIADLNLKLSELKKKLARMVELVNKYMRTHE
jgi:hypothetical protein